MAEFQKFIEFPAKVDFRVITLDIEGIEEQIALVIKENFNLNFEAPVTRKPSKNGKYVSLAIQLTVSDEKQMNSIYSVLGKLEAVKYVL